MCCVCPMRRISIYRIERVETCECRYNRITSVFPRVDRHCTVLGLGTSVVWRLNLTDTAIFMLLSDEIGA